MSVRKIIWSCCLSIMVVCTVTAKPTRYLKVGRTVTLNNAGVKLRLFKGLKPQPLPGIQRLKFVNRVTGEQITKYSLTELWLHDQALARWQSSIASVIFFKVALKAPVTNAEILKKDAYEEWKQGNAISYTPEELTRWLKTLAPDLKVDSDGKIIKKGKNLVIKEYSGSSKVKGTYDIFQIKAYLIQHREQGKSNYYALLYHVLESAKIKKSLKAIKKSIASLTFFAPPVVASKKSRSSLRTAKNSERTEEYLKDRRRIINNVKNMKDWWYNETDNYLIISNLKTRKELSFLQTQIEDCRRVFEKAFPLKRKLNAVSVVKVFKDRDDYVNYVGQLFAWTGGIWLTSRNELVISPSFYKSRRRNRDAIGLVLNHEGFHQYIYYALGGKMTSPWFNEGNATYFEGIELGRGKGLNFKVETGRRLNRMQSLLPRTGELLAQMLRMNYKQFYAKQQRDINYPFAWGLSYFLHNGCNVLRKKNNYRQIMPKYYQAMVDGYSAEEATELAWQDVDVKEFISDFSKFWSSKRLIKKAEKVKF